MSLGFITGWCNEQPGHPAPLHNLCHHTYTTATEKTYVCSCPCHLTAEVRQVPRRPQAASTPEKPAEEPTEAPPVHAVQRRPKPRRQVRRV